MKIAVPREILPDENRVAIIPDTVKKLVKKGWTVSVEEGAGKNAFFPDDEYREAGAHIESSVESLFADANVVLKVQKPSFNKNVGKNEIEMMGKGSALIAFLQPTSNIEIVKKLAERHISAFSMDSIPRITRAQSMDALSSMSMIAGYKSVLIAAHSLGKFFPMFMTAAGTIAPARVLIIGAGVAGLQAIATARRLGAVVEAFDARPVVKEEVKSLGAEFIELGVEHDKAQDEGGYAKQLSEDIYHKERDLIRTHIVKADVVITTALIPGQKAPLLITKEMVKDMKRGSVIVDLAAEQGGNCELTQPGKEVTHEGVTIHGAINIPSTMPVHASHMYSKNIEKFLLHITDDKGLKVDLDDEITRGALITHRGEIVHQRTKELTVQGR